MKKILFFLILALVVASFAAKAPTHHSLRAEAMGNAHVALVDDKEAIYFNYAGLSQINRLGNFEKRPEQGVRGMMMSRCLLCRVKGWRFR